MPAGSYNCCYSAPRTYRYSPGPHTTNVVTVVDVVVDVVVVVVMVVVVVVVSVSVVDVRVLDVLVRVDDVLVVEVAVMVVVATFTSYLKYVVPPWATSHRSAVWCLPMVHHL